MKSLTLAALVTSFALATVALADTTTPNSKTTTGKTPATTAATTPTMKMDKMAGCSKSMDKSAPMSCCGM